MMSNVEMEAEGTLGGDKMVLRLLSDDQKARHVNLSWDVLEHLEGNSEFLHDVITANKTYVFQYDPETKWQSLK